MWSRMDIILTLVLGALCALSAAEAAPSDHGDLFWKESTTKLLDLQQRGCDGVEFETYGATLFRVSLRHGTRVPPECEISMNVQNLVKGDCIDRNWSQGTCNVPGELGIQRPKDICPHLSRIGMSNDAKHTDVACLDGTNYIVVRSNCDEELQVHVKIEVAYGTGASWILQNACHNLDTEDGSVVGAVVLLIILALIILSCVACCCLCPGCPCYWKKEHDERMRQLMGPDSVAPTQTQPLLANDSQSTLQHSKFEHSKFHHSKVQHETYGRARDPEMYDYHEEA